MLEPPNEPAPAVASLPAHGVSWGEALLAFAEIAALSFGGPAAQIAVMHRVVVDDHRWVSEERFLHALNYCMLLPGPEAQQLATYLGWLLYGIPGGLVAGSLFVLPGFLSILALSLLYVYQGDTLFLTGLLAGLKPAVLAFVVEALLRIAGRVLHGPALYALSIAAFLALFLFNIPFPLIILAAALLGGFAGAIWPEAFAKPPEKAKEKAEPKSRPAIDDDVEATHEQMVWCFIAAGVCLILWWLPLGILMWQVGSEHVLVQQGLYFSQTAMVTFGGAYAVLAYVKQQAVDHYHWLDATQMQDSLAMAETTPGPLIQVVQFVAFLGAWQSTSDPAAKLWLALAASVLVTWVTYLPCFLWIFLGAPFLETVRRWPMLNRATTAVTAAVVGVIFHLAVWLTIHTLWSKTSIWESYGLRIEWPEMTSFQWPAAVIAATSALLLLRLRAGMFATLGVAAALGVLAKWLVG